MGEGYSVLLWDSYGGGLVMVNARLLSDGGDLYGNPANWFSCDEDMTDVQVIEKHGLKNFPYYKIIWGRNYESKRKT